MADRISTLAGDAFQLSLSSDYDVVLIPNFLHHFDFTTCVAFLRKTHAALRSGGRVAIVEFVVNEDRVTPPETAGFSLGMLASTPSGDAYTLRELAEMLENAGFTGVDHRLLPPGVATAIIARK